MPTTWSDRRVRWLQVACVLLGIAGLVAYAVSKFSSGRLVVIVTAISLVGFFITLVQRPDIDPQRVVAMGYSLGTGVAVQLAAVRPIAASVLVAPYDSMTLIGLKQSPMFAPLMGIMKRYFDSMALAPDIDTPLLALVGTADTAVLPERSLKLVEGWGGEAQVKQYEGEDHNLLLHENNSWRDIAQFLERVAQD